MIVMREYAVLLMLPSCEVSWKMGSHQEPLSPCKNQAKFRAYSIRSEGDTSFNVCEIHAEVATLHPTVWAVEPLEAGVGRSESPALGHRGAFSETVGAPWAKPQEWTEDVVDLDMVEESALATAQSIIQNAISKSGISHAEMARRMGRNRSFISRILSGSHNLTIKTMARSLAVCGFEVRLQPTTRVAHMACQKVEEEVDT